MSHTYKDKIGRPCQGVKMGLNLGDYVEGDRLMSSAKGVFIFEMRDARTGELLAFWEKPNVITLDAGIMAARLFRNSMEPNAGSNNGLRMLAIGTGATGNILSPDAPQNTQRKLNNQIARRAFSSAQFRDGDGVAVNYPTNIVDFTTTFGETVAVGPLNEMGLVSPFSSNQAVTNWINNGTGTGTAYDQTIDVSSKDLLANYLTFSVISKAATAIVTITWRLTF